MNTSGEEMLHEKARKLQEWFSNLRSVLVAFSGGIDSTLVLKAAYDQLGENTIAVTAVSPTFPKTEIESVQQVSQEIGARLILTETNQLNLSAFVLNDHSRCAHCKIDLHRTLAPIQQQMNIPTIVDGTHLDDLGDDRPGIQASQQLGVKNPLVEVGFGKDDVRTLARNLGLSNWNKPAGACLSSRVPRGTLITLETLQRVEKAEEVLLQEGFRQVRVRAHGQSARIELGKEELPALLDASMRQHIILGIKAAGFATVTVDLEGYRQGGGNTA